MSRLRQAWVVVLFAGWFAAAPAGAVTFSEWQAGMFTSEELANPAISGPNADPDGDQRANFVEYALGLDPFAIDVEPISPTLGANGFTLTYPEVVGACDLLYHFAESGDLQYWITPNSPTRTILADDGVMRTVSVFNPSAPLAPAKWFNRLQIVFSADGTESLTAPTGLSGTLQIPFALSLGWNDNARIETGYTVEKDSGSGFVPVADLAADRNHWFDEAIVGSTTYTYRVRARQGSASSGASEFTITTPLDSDGDGLSDYLELNTYFTDPFNTDTDGDGMPDGWEVKYGFNPKAFGDQYNDSDNDSLTNGMEYKLGLDPRSSDSDGNGVPDSQEDADGDGLPNRWEVANGTNPATNDAEEDPDNDGLTNAEEQEAGTYPFNAYSDGDSVNDGDDGWALDGELSPPRVPEAGFIALKPENLLSVSGNIYFTELNDKGFLLGRSASGDLVVWNGEALRNVSIDVDYPEFASFRVMNNLGQIVGRSRGENPTPAKWDPSGGVTELSTFRGPLPAGSKDKLYTEWPLAINDLGEVVSWVEGSSATPTPSTENPNETKANFYEFGLLNPGTKMGGQNIIENDDVVRAETTFLATQINNSGQVIGSQSWQSGKQLLHDYGGTTNPAVFDNGSVQLLPTDGNGGIANSLTDGPDAVICGNIIASNSYRPALWVKSQNHWVNLPPGRLNGKKAALSGGCGWINKRREIVGLFQSATQPQGFLIRNGEIKDFESFGINVEYGYGLSINNQGVVLAALKKREVNSEKSYLLVPADLAVDANRDGTIRFAGNFQTDKTKPVDKTTEAKPFRFWCNDDNDTYNENGGEDVVPVLFPDSEDDEINSMRDLEDFTRLWLHIGAFYDEISNGTFKIGLKWKNTNSTSPSIKVYKSADPNGSDDYLKVDQAGQDQFAAEYRTALATVAGATPAMLPQSLFSDFSEQNPVAHLLFEGITEGKGQLCITIHKADGTEIGEGPGVWLDLKNIKKMYQRGHAVPDFSDGPFAHTDSWNPPAVGSQPYDNGNPFSQPEDEEKKAVIYVHGINGPDGQSDAYATWQNDSETVFKRLWHQGFKGRFATFKWLALTPASDSPIPNPSEFRFNESEYRAWKCGQGLAQFINTLPDANGYTKNLYSFSQGAIVCGAALRLPECHVTNYVMSQAAAPAGCYDATPAINSYTDFLNAEATSPTPDATNDLGYRGYLSGLNVTGSVVSFFNQVDYALKKGRKTLPVLGEVNTSWEGNQILFKPDPNAWMHNNRIYVYDSGPPNNPYAIGERCFLRDVGPPLDARRVLDIHESMSFVARPRSEAAGASDEVAGRITGRYNVGPDTASNFRDTSSDHGGQFSRRIQQTQDYYENLLTFLTEE